MSNIQYYRLKVGKSDSLYSIFKDERIGGLWNGWCVKDILEAPLKGKSDAKFIREAGENGGIIMVWDRFEQKLALWKITGKVRELNEKEKGVIKEFDRLDPKKWAAIKNYNYKSSHSFFDWIVSGSIIPAKKILEISRSSLPAFIDSLSVHNYFNRGTFRPLRVVNKDHILPFEMDKEKYESAYGAIVRKYFDWILSTFDESFARYLNLNTQQMKQLMLSCMSPAQLETFCALLTLDLGLTLEIGIGKAMDTVDVRATFAHKANFSAEELIRDLEDMGVKVSSEMKLRLDEEKTLFVQCKNYDYQKSSKDVQGVLFLSNNSKSQVIFEDVLSLNYFVSGNVSRLKHVSDWLQRSLCFFENKPRPKTYVLYEIRGNKKIA